MAGILPTTFGGAGGGILDNLIGSMASVGGPFGNAVLQQRLLQGLQQDPQFQQLSLPQQMDVLNNAQSLHDYSVGQKVEDANGNVRIFNPYNQQITGTVYNVPQAPKAIGKVDAGNGISSPVIANGTNVSMFNPGFGQPAAQPGQPSGQPAAPGQPGQPPQVGGPLGGMVQFGNQAAGQKAAYESAGKNDADAFQKEYTAIQNTGNASNNGIEKAQLMKNLTLQPGYYSGPFSKNVQAFNQFRAIFGSNPSAALPTEAFNKVANDMLTEQIKSMGGSGVGRVLQSEVNMMKQAIASLGITPQSNRALAEMISRVYQQNQDIAGIARQVAQSVPPGQRNVALDAAIAQYRQSHQMFSPEEQQHPQLLGAPDAPPQALQGPQQLSAWGKSVGLQSGDPVRVGQRIIKVP